MALGPWWRVRGSVFQGGVAERREGERAERAGRGDPHQDQPGRVQGGHRTAGPGLRRVQHRDQADTERPGDSLPGIEQRVGVAELLRPQRLYQGL